MLFFFSSLNITVEENGVRSQKVKVFSLSSLQILYLRELNLTGDFTKEHLDFGTKPKELKLCLIKLYHQN